MFPSDQRLINREEPLPWFRFHEKSTPSRFATKSTPRQLQLKPIRFHTRTTGFDPREPSLHFVDRVQNDSPDHQRQGASPFLLPHHFARGATNMHSITKCA
jgi:hypothetical protein